MFTPTLAQLEPILREIPTPFFLTSEQHLRDRVSDMRRAFGPLGGRIYFAMKANFNPSVTKVLHDAGIDGIDAVSPNEIELAKRLGFTADQIMFTGSNSSTHEIEWVGNQGVIQNLGSVSELTRYARLFPGTKISLRLCPEVTAGESDKVKTGHAESKFGITLHELDEVQRIMLDAKLELAGLHIHIGSGFYDARDMVSAVQVLCNVAKDMKPTTFIDIGGGYGVAYRPGEEGLDIEACAAAIAPILDDLETALGKRLELRLEPGKFLTTRSTALVVTLTTLKDKGGITFAGVDTGFNHLIRPTMYGSYHHVVNVSRPDGPQKTVRIAGNVCETGDILNEEVAIGNPHEGDILAILCAGGYGASMSSYYNLRPRAAEVMLRTDGSFVLTKRPETLDEIMETYTGY